MDDLRFASSPGDDFTCGEIDVWRNLSDVLRVARLTIDDDREKQLAMAEPSPTDEEKVEAYS